MSASEQQVRPLQARRTGLMALFSAFHFGPRAGAHAVNLRILHLEGEQLGEDILRRVNRRVVADVGTDQRRRLFVSVSVVDVIADMGNDLRAQQIVQELIGFVFILASAGMAKTSKKASAPSFGIK